jgi:hypothetical protein
VDTSNFLTKEQAHVVYVNQAGDKMEGDLDMNSYKVMNGVLDNCVVTETPSADTHLVSKSYLDSRLTGFDAVYVNESGDTMTGELRMSQSKLTGLPNPSEDTDAVNKRYADKHRSHFTFGENALQVQKSVDMNSNKITELPDPVNASDAVNKKYVDNLQNKHVNHFTLARDKLEMKKNVDMNSNKITELPNPENPSDAANKGYVDRRLIIPFRVAIRNLKCLLAEIILSDIPLPVLQNTKQVYVTATLHQNKFITSLQEASFNTTMTIEKTINGTIGQSNSLEIKFILLVSGPPGSERVLGDIEIEGIVIVANEVTQVGIVRVTKRIIGPSFRANEELEEGAVEPVYTLSAEAARSLF